MTARFFGPENRDQWFRTDFQRMELARWYKYKDPDTGVFVGDRIAHRYYLWTKIDRGHYQTEAAEGSHADGDVWECLMEPTDRAAGGPWVLTRTVGTEKGTSEGRWDSLEDAKAYQNIVVRAEAAILEERRNPKHFEAFEMQFEDPPEDLT